MNKTLKGVLTAVAAALLAFGVASCQNDSGGTGGDPGGSVGSEDMMSLPPMKDQFNNYFMIGNIFSPGDASSASGISNARLARHYNVLTAENAMKPDQISQSQGSYNYTTADRMVDAARASGIKVVGHTLMWHSQIPQWQRGMASQPAATALAALKKNITDVVTHYKGKIYSWDVLNEVFPDGVSASADWKTSMRVTQGNNQGNPWFMSIGSDFVYEGFLAAREADPAAILYYNDYNLNSTGKATMVRNMVRDVNEKYKSEKGETRLLIEGIGMQSHHNTDVPASQIKASLDLFKPLGVKISISELDVLSQGWGDYSASRAPTDAGKAKAADLYGEYFKLFVQYSDIIERVTFWGVNDEQSWRARGKPLIFEGSGSSSKTKPAYYKVIDVLK